MRTRCVEKRASSSGMVTQAAAEARTLDEFAHVIQAQFETEPDARLNCVPERCSYGSSGFAIHTAARLQLKHNLRPRGWPRKE